MKKKLTIFLSLLMAVACVYWQKSDVEAETWQQYLARQWQTCETTFSALDKSTSLTPWNGTNTVTVVPTDTDGNGLVEVTTPEQLRYAIENNMSLELMNGRRLIFLEQIVSSLKDMAIVFIIYILMQGVIQHSLVVLIIQILRCKM